MNLKTHTAYSEIQIDQHNRYTAKIIDGKGKVLFEKYGAGKTYDLARQEAKDLINSQSDKYLRK